jgi:hypothetical protein
VFVSVCDGHKSSVNREALKFYQQFQENYGPVNMGRTVLQLRTEPMTSIKLTLKELPKLIGEHLHIQGD